MDHADLRVHVSCIVASGDDLLRASCAAAAETMEGKRFSTSFKRAAVCHDRAGTLSFLLGHVHSIQLPCT